MISSVTKYYGSYCRFANGLEGPCNLLTAVFNLSLQNISVFRPRLIDDNKNKFKKLIKRFKLLLNYGLMYLTKVSKFPRYSHLITDLYKKFLNYNVWYAPNQLSVIIF